MNGYIFSSESVSAGHPDKVADQISDAVLDACLAKDREARVACETMVGPDMIVNMGEITAAGFEEVDVESIAREVIKSIGYNNPDEHFSYDTFRYVTNIHSQSPDIARGVNRESDELQGAGDQGMMFGYATNETPELMPFALVWSHKVLMKFEELFKSGVMPELRPDAKSQISVLYENNRPVSIDTVVVSHQTTEAGANDATYGEIEKVARDVLEQTGILTNDAKFYVNPTGKFVVGGPCGDSGLTGRKIIVDTYGGAAAHGGGAFSGKDSSKVDRSAAYYARYAAKNIVAAGYADKCQVQVAYAIGVDRPVSICVNTFGTAHGVDDGKLNLMLKDSGIFDFRPWALIRELGLKLPTGWCYKDTAVYGHFGRDIFPWEKNDRVNQIREFLK